MTTTPNPTAAPPHRERTPTLMAGDTLITIVGNLTADVELRFSPSGDAVANFTIASTPRSFDKTTNDWKDGETLFMRCSLWREAGENASATLTRGMRVLATGRLVSRSWQTPEGENRTVMEMQVDEVGPSLKYATAVVTKTPKKDGGGSSGGWGGQPQGGQQQRPPAQPAQPRAAQPAAEPDPWAAGGQQGGGQQAGGWGGGVEAPPF